MTATSTEAPARARDSLAMPATVLVAVWSAAAIAVALLRFAERTVQVHRAPGALPVSGALPALSFAAFVLLLPALQVLVAGLVLGLVAIARTRGTRVARAGCLVAVIVGLAVLELWLLNKPADDLTVDRGFAHDGRAAALLACVVPVMASACVARLLHVVRWPSRR